MKHKPFFWTFLLVSLALNQVSSSGLFMNFQDLFHYFISNLVVPDCRFISQRAKTTSTFWNRRTSDRRGARWPFHATGSTTCLAACTEVAVRSSPTPSRRVACACVCVHTRGAVPSAAEARGASASEETRAQATTSADSRCKTSTRIPGR